jgi:hypothetical protein
LGVGAHFRHKVRSCIGAAPAAEAAAGKGRRAGRRGGAFKKLL